MHGGETLARYDYVIKGQRFGGTTLDLRRHITAKSHRGPNGKVVAKSKLLILRQPPA